MYARNEIKRIWEFAVILARQLLHSFIFFIFFRNSSLVRFTWRLLYVFSSFLIFLSVARITRPRQSMQSGSCSWSATVVKRIARTRATVLRARAPGRERVQSEARVKPQSSPRNILTGRRAIFHGPRCRLWPGRYTIVMPTSLQPLRLSNIPRNETRVQALGD